MNTEAHAEVFGQRVRAQFVPLDPCVHLLVSRTVVLEVRPRNYYIPEMKATGKVSLLRELFLKFYPGKQIDS